MMFKLFGHRKVISNHKDILIFHFTSGENLSHIISISEKGIEVSYGINCEVAGDDRTRNKNMDDRTYVSIGKKASAKMFSAFYEMFLRAREFGFADDGKEELWKKIRERDDEHLLGEGIYLVCDIDIDKIIVDKLYSNSLDNQGYITFNIPPEKLKVCVIKRNKEIISASKYDVGAYLIYNYDDEDGGYMFLFGKKDELKKNKRTDKLEYISLQDFIKMDNWGYLVQSRVYSHEEYKKQK